MRGLPVCQYSRGDFARQGRPSVRGRVQRQGVMRCSVPPWRQPSARSGPLLRRGAIVDHPERAERYAVLLEAVRSGGHRVSEAGISDSIRSSPSTIRATSPSYGTFGRARGVAGLHGRDPDAALRPHALAPPTGGLARSDRPLHRRYVDTGPGGDLGCDLRLGAGRHRGRRRRPDRSHRLRPVPTAGPPRLCRFGGGFCYFNNSAIAAERLRATSGGRVAILDIDVHHGNGSQGIFYERADVLTVSVHADPIDYFPYFAGYADETAQARAKASIATCPCRRDRATRLGSRRSLKGCPPSPPSRRRPSSWRSASTRPRTTRLAR